MGLKRPSFLLRKVRDRKAPNPNFGCRVRPANQRKPRGNVGGR